MGVASATSATEDDVNRPVQKVLKLLGEMKVTLEKEQKTDIEMFEKMDPTWESMDGSPGSTLRALGGMDAVSLRDATSAGVAQMCLRIRADDGSLCDLSFSLLRPFQRWMCAPVDET